MKITIGKDAPELVNAVIEIPMGSDIKYEMDKETGMLKVDRILYTSMSYPFNYGYIAQTLAEDGDPLDILVISDRQFIPGSFVEVKPVGILNMEDEEGIDYKIVAVPKGKVSQTYANVNDIKDLPDALKKKIVHFFEHYKELEPNKWIKISGWEGAEKAKAIIKKSIKK
jgi:inorganic pyrophosphatase